MRTIFILLIATNLVMSCKKDKDTKSFKHKALPSDISKLYEFQGDETSDTVWIYVQGGPVTDREYAFEETYQDGSDLYPFFKDDFRVYPYQAQHLDKTIAPSALFDFKAAKKEAAKSSEVVKRIVEHFNAKNKVVYLVGHSYGSFIVNDVLARYGSIARKTISLNGRLEMDDVVWQGFSKGEEWLFEDTGINPTLNTSASDDIEEQNMRKLAAGLGYNRYTSKYANVDLSDAIFFTAGDDKYVGDFTQNTIDFLQANAEQLYVIPDIGHGDVFNPNLMKELHDVIIKDN